MAVQIQLRRDDSATWSALNPVLLAAEFGVETDTGKFKIGDGSTPWGLLAYAASTPSELSSAVSSAITNLIDAAPGALDTLNELAAAINDDPEFFSTITSQIALKADATDLSDHISDTLGVHGIADTSALETQTGSQSKADAARDAAKDYADSLAVNYDVIGSADAAEQAAKAYADSLAPNYDSAGSAAAAQAASETYTDTSVTSHNSSTTNVHGIADTSALETQTGAQAKADAAQSAAEAYADSLSVNYDPAGSATAAQTAAQAYADQAEADAISAAAADATTKANAAQSAAEAYADSLAVNYDAAGSASAAQIAAESYADAAIANLVDTAPDTLNTLNELAAALGDDANFSTTVATQIGTKADASDLTDHTSATVNVHGIADTAELETQTGAQSKADAAVSSANTYTDTSINSLDTDDIEEGVTNKYFTDERAQDAAAQMIVAGNHTNVSVDYDDAAGTLSLTGAETYGSTEFAADLATKDTDDLSEGTSNLYFTAQRALDATASAYDPTGSAAAAQAAAESYTDSAVAAFDALPSQAGNTGKYLTTDGSTASWQTLPGLATSVEVLFEAPSGTPPLGACYFDALLNTLRIYNGGAWVSMVPESGSIISAGSASNPGSVLYNAGDSDDPATGTAPVDGGTSAT